MSESRILHKIKIHYHGLSPLLMQNSYFKLILAIKMLSVDRFSKFLQVLLRQVELIRKLFPALEQSSSLQKFTIRCQFLQIKSICTIMTPHFLTGKSWQTVHIQIGQMHFLIILLHIFEEIPYSRDTLFKF